MLKLYGKLLMFCSRQKFRALAILLTLGLFATSCSFTFSSYSLKSFFGTHARRGAAFRSEGRYEEAIKEYLFHIEARRNASRQAVNENPDFYLLIIGDIYLDMDRPEDAEQSYLAARDRGVENSFLADRFRRLSRYFENLNKIDQAIEVLRKYRIHDPMLYDVIIDRLHKKAVYSEDPAAAVQDSPR